jgi:hypothetical protein
LSHLLLAKILTDGKIVLPERGGCVELPEVVAKLVEILRHDQHGSGQDDAEKVTPSCRPLSDLKGFDSLLIPSIVRRLARELGHLLPKGTRVKNIYCAPDGRKKLTVRVLMAMHIGDTWRITIFTRPHGREHELCLT